MVVLSSMDVHPVLSFNPSFLCMDRECMREAVLLWIARQQFSSMCLRLCWSLACVCDGLGSCRLVWSLGLFLFSFPRRLGRFRWRLEGLLFDGMMPFGMVFVPGVVLLPWVGSFLLRWDGGPPLWGLETIDTDTAFFGDGIEEREWMHPHPRVERSNPHLRHLRVVVVVVTHEREDESKRQTSQRNQRRVTTRNQAHNKTSETKDKKKEIVTADASNTKPTPHVELGWIGCPARRKPST